MRRRLVAVLLVALTGCSGNKAAGAAALVAWGVLGSAASRAAGGCYALCVGNQVCNTETGLCEYNPCAACSMSQHCELGGPVPRCVEDSVPADLFRPPPPSSAPVLAPVP